MRPRLGWQSPRRSWPSWPCATIWELARSLRLTPCSPIWRTSATTQVIETLLRLSRLPQKAPKTFASFDFDRIRGRDAAALRKLPALANLHARKNLAFIGPGGIGKTHLAQAYGRECCLSGYKTYYLKATELRDKLRRAADSGSTSRTVSALVKPSCLIVDEVGRCTF